MSVKQNRLLSLNGQQKITFNLQQTMLLLIALTRRVLNGNDFLPKYGNTKTSCILVLMK